MEQSATTILLACLDYGGTVSAEQFASVTAEEWQQVIELAGRHNVTPLLYHRLQKMNVTLPGDLQDKLKQVQRKSALQIMLQLKELNKLLRLFQEKSIPVIALKGAYLTEAVYEQLGLRTMRDIDLLAKKEDLPRIDLELLAMGCVPKQSNRVISQENHHFEYKLPGSGLILEIHWKIFENDLPMRIDMDGLWSRAQATTLAQVPSLVFCPEDLLLHLCLHTIYHAYKTLATSYDMRIRMLCDIGEVLRQHGSELDWQGLADRARQWGAGRAVYVLLRVTEELLRVPLPPGWLASLQPENFNERYLEITRDQLLGERSDPKNTLLDSNYLARLSGSKGLGNKIALTRARLLPSPQTMALKYPARANSWRIYLYYPVRWLDLLWHYGASLWRMIRGDQKTRSLAEQTNQIMELHDWLMSG